MTDKEIRRFGDYVNENNRLPHGHEIETAIPYNGTQEDVDKIMEECGLNDNVWGHKADFWVCGTIDGDNYIMGIVKQ